jgi:hypothetical protein
MKNQIHLLNRIKTIELHYEGLEQERALERFFNALPEEDKRKFGSSGIVAGGVTIFRGEPEDFHRIMEGYKGDTTGLHVIIDNIRTHFINKTKGIK